MSANRQTDQFVPREGYVPVGNAELYYREIGKGQKLIILHGGPDFDHNYFLPAMDRFADSFRFIYYAQRGRGKSSGHVQPNDVSLVSEMSDLEKLREYFRLESIAVLGHSWGGLLAMEYALRHPHRVSHMILLNTAPASQDDFLLFRQARARRVPGDMEKLKAISSTAQHAEGELEADAAYYRIHFEPAVRQPEHLEGLVNSLRINFTPADIRKARQIEARLMQQTWLSRDYSLLPALKRLRIPTLVIHGDHDLIPAECAAHIAQAIPGARYVVLKDCGHFSYLECPDEVRRALADFFQSTRPSSAQQLTASSQ